MPDFVGGSAGRGGARHPSRRTPVRPLIESLEDRKLLRGCHITLVYEHFLYIVGTPAADVATVEYDGGDVVATLSSSDPRCRPITRRFRADTVGQISFYGRDDGGTGVEPLGAWGPDEADQYENGTSILSVAHGGEGNDTLIGGSGVDFLHGDAGDNVLIGGDGADDLRGGGGNDSIVGGGGNDSITGSRGNDTLDGGSGSDKIYGFVSDETSGPERAAHLWDGGSDSILGGTGNDFLYGSGGDDTISGGLGNDLIMGVYDTPLAHLTRPAWLSYRSGNDRLSGDEGNDTIHGMDGDDLIYGKDGNDQLYGGYGDRTSDASGNDHLYGGKGRDSLYGLDGNDYLDGGGDAAVDLLTGGAGADTFIQYESDGTPLYAVPDMLVDVNWFVDRVIRRRQVLLEGPVAPSPLPEPLIPLPSP